MDVWIEIADRYLYLPKLLVTSYMDVWIEIQKFAVNVSAMHGHILYGCVD